MISLGGLENTFRDLNCYLKPTEPPDPNLHNIQFK